MAERKVLLQTYAQEDGPKIPVSNMVAVSVRDAGKEDVIQLCFSDHDLLTDPDPVVIKGSGVHNLRFPRGKVHVTRLKGDSPITVVAHCARSGNGIEADERRGVWGPGVR